MTIGPKQSPDLTKPEQTPDLTNPEVAEKYISRSVTAGMEKAHVSHLGNVKYVKALAPLMEMFGFAGAIRSLSQGRATPSPMEFHSYKELPSNIARSVIEGKE